MVIQATLKAENKCCVYICKSRAVKTFAKNNYCMKHYNMLISGTFIVDGSNIPEEEDLR